jgi:hypothetical protein
VVFRSTSSACRASLRSVFVFSITGSTTVHRTHRSLPQKMQSAKSSGGNLPVSTSCSARFFRAWVVNNHSLLGARSRHCYAIMCPVELMNRLGWEHRTAKTALRLSNPISHNPDLLPSDSSRLNVQKPTVSSLNPVESALAKKVGGRCKSLTSRAYRTGMRRAPCPVPCLPGHCGTGHTVPELGQGRKQFRPSRCLRQ